MTNTRCCIHVISCCLLVASLHADVKLPAIFGNEMVIQRETQAPIWGWAEPGEKVGIKTSWGASATTTANDDGKWSVRINTPEAGGPHIITVRGNNTIELSDVLAGEVWFASGQSNMQMTVADAWENAREIKNAKNYPTIRLFDIKRTPSNQPAEDVTGTWKTCSPDSVKHFSAAAYYFGKKLHRELDVPIGLILASWGATSIESWTERDAQLNDPVVKTIISHLDKADANYDEAKAQERHAMLVARYEKKLAEYTENGTQGRKPRMPAQPRRPNARQAYPGNLYNGMVRPVVPFAIRGVIWYQGESNTKRAGHYEVSLQRLIKTWRKDWGQGDFPFYFVQLPNFRAPWKNPMEFDDWPVVRQAFLNTVKSTPNTGMAITIDVGHISNIHPGNKIAVGERLAAVALRKTYGQKDHAWTGPYIIGGKIEGDKAIITFENGNSPLAVRKGKKLIGFALADEHGDVVRAEATIQGENAVIVSSPKVKKPVSVLYAWANNPLGANLMNKAGLPASPFLYGPMPQKHP